MQLPTDLEAAISAELTSVPLKSLARSVADLSDRYRAGNGRPQGGRFLQSSADIAAYAAYRLPATFAAVLAALEQVRDRQPAWQPGSVLDVGAGPGTATWAAAALWPQLQRATLLEREPDMIDLGRRLAAHSAAVAVRTAEWLSVDVTAAWDVPPHGLVILSYVIGELPEDRCAALVAKLWERTAGTLVIIEPGSVPGFSRVKSARDQLLTAGARIVAPCPHERACPLPTDDWCHFAQRVARSALHRQVKAGELAYEDEKYSFVAASRQPGSPIAGRVIRQPQPRPGHVHLRLCSDDGLTTRTVTRKRIVSCIERQRTCAGARPSLTSMATTTTTEPRADSAY